jgi:hypothetical protein
MAAVMYTIIPRGGAYWIEATTMDGVRRTVERHATEAEALRRLHELRPETEELAAERSSTQSVRHRA